MKTTILILSLLLAAVITYCIVCHPEPEHTVQVITDTTALSTAHARIIQYRAAEDSLIQIARNSARKARQEAAQRKIIENEYKALSERLNAITDDSAVGLFLDRADCSEYPVRCIDSAYLAPVEAIRFYNDVSYSHDRLTLLNKSLQVENCYNLKQVESLQSAYDTCRAEVGEYIGIIDLKDKMLDSEYGKNKKLSKTVFGLGVLSVVLVVVGLF